MRIILFFTCFLFTISAFSQDILGEWEMDRIEPVVKTNKEETTNEIIKEITRNMSNDGILLRFMDNGKVIASGQEDIYSIKDGILTIIRNGEPRDLCNYIIREDTLILLLTLQEINSRLYEEIIEDNPGLEIEKADINIYFHKLSGNSDIIGIWKYKDSTPVVKTKSKEVTEKIIEKITEANHFSQQELIFRFGADGRSTINEGPLTLYSARNGNLYIDDNHFKYNIADNILTISFNLRYLDFALFSELVEENPNIFIEEAIINVHFEKLSEDSK